jgi:hypothetical protein
VPSELAYDVRLTGDGAFAVLEAGSARAVSTEEARSLPGYFRRGGEVQVWLSQDLKELICSRGLEAAPGVIDAIDAEVSDANRARPWASDLERASSCADPARYPPRLVERLRQLGLLGSPGA